MREETLKELKKVSILCVEDEDGIRGSIVNTLKYYFDDVYEARDGKEAFHLYEKYKPKIVLSDIQMKNVNGIELAKNIRKNDLETTIIMLTAYSNEEYLMDLINLNINHYILKPLNHKKLMNALEKYIKMNIAEKILLCDEFTLELSKREILYKNEPISLRKREKDFLIMLYENNQNITTYTQIEEALWQDKEMTNYALKSFIKELRAKLPFNIIKNIPQEGYILSKC